MDGTAPTTPPTEGRRSRRRRELHEHIFSTARALFLANGFEQTTVEQIAAEADIAQATFFNHFPSKDDVLRDMAGDVFERFGSLIDEQRKRPVGTRERLTGFAERAERVVRRAPELTRRVLLDVLEAAPTSESGGRLTGTLGRMTDLVRDGQTVGDVRRDTPAEVLAEMTIAVVNGAMTAWIRDPDYPLLDRMTRQVELIADALATGTDAAP